MQHTPTTRHAHVGQPTTCSTPSAMARTTAGTTSIGCWIPLMAQRCDTSAWPRAGLCVYARVSHRAGSARRSLATQGFLRREQFAIGLALIRRGTPVLGILGCPNLPYPSTPAETPRVTLFSAVSR